MEHSLESNVPYFSDFCSFFLVISLFKVTFKCSAEVLYSVLFFFFCIVFLSTGRLCLMEKNLCSEKAFLGHES